MFRETNSVAWFTRAFAFSRSAIIINTWLLIQLFDKLITWHAYVSLPWWLLINYCDALTVHWAPMTIAKPIFAARNLHRHKNTRQISGLFSFSRKFLRYARSVSGLLSRDTFNQTQPMFATPTTELRWIDGRNAVAAINLEIARRTKCVIGFKQQRIREREIAAARWDGMNLIFFIRARFDRREILAENHAGKTDGRVRLVLMPYDGILSFTARVLNFLAPRSPLIII